MTLVPLAQLLAFQNQRVVAYYCHHHSTVTLTESQQLFQDLMGWMWLHQYRKSRQLKTWLFGPLLAVDAMWHSFILHTRDYHAFCEQFFNEYFHHDIEPPAEAHELEPDELASFLGDCMEFLGEAWVDRYFGDFMSADGAMS